MTDPSNALQSFQEALLAGHIQLEPGTLDKDLFVFIDEPNDKEFRLTFVRLRGLTVTALVMFVSCERIEGLRCFSIGYAVPESFRNQGRAKEAVSAALSEIRHTLGRRGPFFVEAIVRVDNEPSQRVAAATISNVPIAITEETSALPALQYLRQIERPDV
jgi:RimJ/RimL family protein N-acetyltransferase